MAASKMNFGNIFSLFLIFQFSFNLYFCAEIVPVFIWGDESESASLASPSAFANLKPSEFEEEYLNKFIEKKSLVIAFVQDTLSVEDLSVNGDAFQDVLLEPTIILSKVEDPVSSLKSLSKNVKLSEIDFENDFQLGNLQNQLIIVNLPKTRNVQDRFQALKKNADLIAKFIANLKTKNFVAILTGLKPEWQGDSEIESLRRVVRAAASSSEGVDQGESSINGTFLNFTSFYAYATRAFISIDYKAEEHASLNEQVELVWPPNMAIEPVTPEDYAIKMRWPFANAGNFTNIFLDISFNTSKSTFWMGYNMSLTYSHIDKEEKVVPLRTPYEIGASKGFSFSCSNATFTYKYKNDSKSDYLVQFKIEKFQAEYAPGEKQTQFSSSFDCYTFFTVPLWMGLATIILFTSILAMGIFMLFEVKTMDRFDDPKGKTISVPLVD